MCWQVKLGKMKLGLYSGRLSLQGRAAWWRAYSERVGYCRKPMTEPKNSWILPLLIYSKGTPNIVSIFQFSCCDEIIFPLPILQIGGNWVFKSRQIERRVTTTVYFQQPCGWTVKNKWEKKRYFIDMENVYWVFHLVFFFFKCIKNNDSKPA